MEARSHHLCCPGCKLGRDCDAKVLIRPPRLLMQLRVVIAIEQDTTDLAFRGWAYPRGVGGTRSETDHQSDFNGALDAILVGAEKRSKA